MSRMDKYQSGTIVKERTVKNKNLYDNVPDVNIDYITLESGTLINPSDIKKNKRSDYQKMKELENILPKKEKETKDVKEQVKKEDRVYDINEILKLAKESKLFQDDEKRRLINTEYNILTKLDIEKINQTKDLKKEDLKDLINEIYGNERKGKRKKKSRTLILEESSDLLEDLKESSYISVDNLNKESKDLEIPLTNTIADSTLELEIDAEISKKILDKEESKKPKSDTVEIASLIKKEESENLNGNFLKDDFKDEEEEFTDELLVEDKKSKVILVFVVILVLILMGITGYLVYYYFLAV